MSTGIEWTDETWNPTTGCDRVSPGCDNCYALGMAKRLKAMGQADYQTDGDPKTSGPGFGLAVHPHRLDQPLRWKKPRRIFVNSMSDLFHDDTPDEYISQVFAVMSAAKQHTFQLLTKRHGRMRSLLNSERFRKAVLREWLFGDMIPDDDTRPSWPLPNVWLGVSVENQQWANIRIPALLDTPAAVRFLSCEPLLGPVSLFDNSRIDTGTLVDWVIVGGESGPKARPMQPQWARQLRDECNRYGIPFLFKQWGEHVTHGQMTEAAATAWDIKNGTDQYDASVQWRVGKHAAGRELDGRTWDQYPAVAS